MYNSILHKTSKFVKENNISISGVCYKFSDVFPAAFYEVVIQYLQQAYPKFTNNPKIEDFFIGFDKNKNAYFEFTGKIIDENPINNTKKEYEARVIVIEDYLRYECNFPPALLTKEYFFLEAIKKLDAEKNKEILDNLPSEFKKRFIKESKIDDLFENIANKIIEYIKYIDSETKKSYELLEKEIEDGKEIEKIYFFEGEASTNENKTTTHTPTIKTERKNPELPFEERKAVLDSYSSEAEFEARSKNSDSVYYVKAFKIKDKCKLIMEPVEGNKYTKAVFLDQEKLATAEIRKIVISYLELNRNETTNTSEVTRHSHTTLDEYKKLLDYIIEEKNRGISSSTKMRIDEASKKR